jgi:hypothetical protein
MEYGGDFAMWLRTSWSEVVGTQGRVKAHHARGVDVTVSFWTDEEARTRDRVTVAAYLAGESAKFAQKRPPEDFPGVGRYWGVIGKEHGFAPARSDVVVAHPVAYELERRLTRLIRARMLSKWGKVGAFDRRRVGSGVMALDLRPKDSERLLLWSEQAAARKNARRVAKGEPAMTEWGPTWCGLPPDIVASLGGEDPRPDRGLRSRGPCGCRGRKFCGDCITDEELYQVTTYGCVCLGREWCEKCFDPERHLPEFMR